MAAATNFITVGARPPNDFDPVSLFISASSHLQYSRNCDPGTLNARPTLSNFHLPINAVP
eukprot:13618974-Heterocapsa_arctica.AAC.1